MFVDRKLIADVLYFYTFNTQRNSFRALFLRSFKLKLCIVRINISYINLFVKAVCFHKYFTSIQSIQSMKRINFHYSFTDV